MKISKLYIYRDNVYKGRRRNLNKEDKESQTAKEMKTNENETT